MPIVKTLYFPPAIHDNQLSLDLPDAKTRLLHLSSCLKGTLELEQQQLIPEEEFAEQLAMRHEHPSATVASQMELA